MISPAEVPDIDPGETLARYVFARSHFRPSDNTVKPDAFMPPADLEMSVTRHLNATEDELWNVGKAIGETSQRTLRGRADIGVADCIDQQLQVLSAPLEDNPNHAHIVA